MSSRFLTMYRHAELRSYMYAGIRTTEIKKERAYYPGYDHSTNELLILYALSMFCRLGPLNVLSKHNTDLDACRTRGSLSGFIRS